MRPAGTTQNQRWCPADLEARAGVAGSLLYTSLLSRDHSFGFIFWESEITAAQLVPWLIESQQQQRPSPAPPRSLPPSWLSSFCSLCPGPSLSQPRTVPAAEDRGWAGWG